MTWNWYNPSKEEAKEAYKYYSDKYYYAANQKLKSERQEEAYRSQRQTASNNLSDARKEKLNFESRVEGIAKIISMLEGGATWQGGNVPEAIQKAQQMLRHAYDSFRNSIKHSDVVAADLETVFETKTVEANSHSANALAAYKAEKQRLEQELVELNSAIATLDTQVSDLNALIRQCNNTQTTLRSSMASYATSAYHFKNKQ